MNQPSIVIIDSIGLVYDGDTIKTRALGGSESACALMAKELAQIGFKVTVYNDCKDVDCKSGIYDNVTYKHITTLGKCDDYYDVMISLRCITPFVPKELQSSIDNSTKYPYGIFDKVRNVSRHKVLWMHDTFIWGDPHVEKLLLNNHIDEMFTLSDFHTSYVTNCWHGGDRRNFEVLKKKIFQTRNGIVKYFDETNVFDKDPNLFVYVAAVSKGLKPLLTNVWPNLKLNLPNAKLKVVGGYYRFSSTAEPDEQQKALEEMAQDAAYKEMGVSFTGIIPQKEVAEVFQKASFFIFPGGFPETFGISALESLYYNTPLLTNRFGALEETAIDSACYHIDYAIEGNSLFPNINVSDQVNKFVRMCYDAYHNRYLHQQKMFACNIVKDIAGWDTVALQWKQHFYKKLNEYLPVEDYRKVSYINDRVHKVFGRRFSNPEEWNTYKLSNEKEINIIIPFYNAKDYIVRCLESVAAQDYNNYSVYIIDDCSNDGSSDLISRFIHHEMPSEIASKFFMIVNQENKGAVYNQINTIRTHTNNDSIVVLLDGDDALVNDPNIFNMYNNLFADDKTDYAYGSCWSEVDNIPLQSQPYPKEVRDAKAYRQYKFNWGMPYPHLRVFRAELVHNIENDDCFKDENGEWFKAGGDNATFYNILEQADPNKIAVVSDIVMLYNDKNPLNDYKVHGELQNKNASKIAGETKIQINKVEINSTPRPMNVEMVPTKDIIAYNTTEKLNNMVKKNILIAIPTARNIEASTFKAIYDLIVPDGYETHFQFFYGYQVDQVRNLIADWVVKGYDYLFAVDSDISFAPDTLVKLLNHDKDVVSGLYIQRIQNQHTLEIFESNGKGGYSHIPYEKIKGRGLVEIGACGFGCALIKKHVLAEIGYPQFFYKSAIDHAHTFSEDLFFANKCNEKGFKIYADTSVICDHTGSYIYRV
jgi:glycosyltransferase involved in cell wall biosynthesis